MIGEPPAEFAERRAPGQQLGDRGDEAGGAIGHDEERVAQTPADETPPEAQQAHVGEAPRQERPVPPAQRGTG